MANNSQGGDSKVVPLGTGQKSGNAWLGIDDRIASGTNGSRPNMAHRYGGETKTGDLFKGNSVATDNKNLNSGGGEKPSKTSGQYGDAPAQGTVGSREDMLKYGGETNVGKLVGLGAGATKEISATDQLTRDLPKQPGMDVIRGTSDGDKNMARAHKGIGKAGGKGQRM